LPFPHFISVKFSDKHSTRRRSLERREENRLLSARCSHSIALLQEAPPLKGTPVNTRRYLFAVGLGLSLCVGQASAFWPWSKNKQHGDTVIIEPPCPHKEAPKLEEPKKEEGKKEEAKAPDQPMAQPPVTDAFAQAPEAGTEAPSSFNPQMMGDQGVGGIAKSNLTFAATGNLTIVGVPFPANGSVLAPVQIPNFSRGPFKIAENESPRPTSRVFVAYNYFNGLKIAPSSSIGTASVSVPSLGLNLTGTLPVTTTGARFDLHRETIGFEWAFADGNASIGIRVPFIQTTGANPQFASTVAVGADSLSLAGNANLDQSDLADITIITKYALLNDRATGNVLSLGLAVTAPTGQDLTLVNGESVHSTLLQPWVGGIYNCGNIYVHGFSGVTIPTASIDVTLLSNDIGLGYWLVRCGDGLFTNVVPTVECHVTTPLNNRGGGALITFPDLVVITGGVHLGMGRSTLLTIGAATPVAGQGNDLYDVEGFVQLNFRF